MTFNDIKTLTYVGNTMIINGVEFQIPTTLNSDISAVQYHKGRTVLEEPLMVTADNVKYQYAIDEWVEAKRVSGLPPVVTQEDINVATSNAIQNMLDTKARNFRYDDINSIGKYLGYDNVFRAQCESLGQWAANCWTLAGQIEADVLNKVRPMPTVAEVLAEMPAYV